MELKNYDEVIQQLLTANEGLISNDYEIISAPKVALKLHANELDNDGVPVKRWELPIYYSDLKVAFIGSNYEMETPISKHYTVQSAEVVYRNPNTDFILLRIKTVIKQEQLEEYSELVGVELL